jgi:hypothetical protein
VGLDGVKPRPVEAKGEEREGESKWMKYKRGAMWLDDWYSKCCLELITVAQCYLGSGRPVFKTI